MKKKKETPKCMICGDRGQVYRAYLEPEIDMKHAKDLVRCPKCTELKSGRHFLFQNEEAIPNDIRDPNPPS